MKKKGLLFIAGALIILIIAAFYFARSGVETNELSYTVTKGTFRNEVVTTGELAALNSQRVSGPMGLYRLRIYEMKIQHLVPEGTIVKKGDVVGVIDQSAMEDAYQDAMNDFQQAESKFIQTKLDTTLTLRGVRDEIRNTLSALEEAKITLEQSQFEPPATIRQEQLKVENTQRSLEQLREKYKIQQEQAEAQMVDAKIQMNRVQARLDQIEKIREQFEVKAPNNGIVTYIRQRGGNKIQSGTQINSWDPYIAELPDLSQMLSNTFVNEIDVRKIKPGQQVKIGLDAFPDARLTGEVKEVANIGEEREDSDAKIFPVTISVNESDSTYLPGMTTINTILLDEQADVLTIPLDAVFNEDEKKFVYKKQAGGIIKQEVKLGKANQNFVIVAGGLKESDEVLLTAPQQAKDAKLQTLSDAE